MNILCNGGPIAAAERIAVLQPARFDADEQRRSMSVRAGASNS
jgi:hypothetical protein